MGILSRVVKKTAKKPLTKKQIQAKTAEVFGALDKMPNIENKRGIYQIRYPDYLKARDLGYEYVPRRMFDNGLAGEMTPGLGDWVDPKTGKHYFVNNGDVFPAETPLPGAISNHPMTKGAMYVNTPTDQKKVLRDVLSNEKFGKKVDEASKVMNFNGGSGSRRGLWLNDPEDYEIHERLKRIDNEIRQGKEIGDEFMKQGRTAEAKAWYDKALEAENFKVEHALDWLDDAHKLTPAEEFYGPFIEDIFGK